MYTTTRPPLAPIATRPPIEDDEVAATPGISPNVVLLGVTSMLTDISSEMVTSILPLYLAMLFGFGPAAFGGFDGIYQAMAAVSCVSAALFADRRRRHKEVAAFGYGLSAICKLGLVLTAGSWLPAIGVLYADRFGKGIRTAPRDALISLSSAPSRLAESFGVHRALDTLGAVLGPMVAAFILVRDPGGYRSIFIVSFLVAVIGVAVLGLFVDGRPTPIRDRATRRRRSGDATGPVALDGADPVADLEPEPDAVAVAVAELDAKVSWRDALALLRDRRYRAVCIVATVLAVMTPGDALIYLTFVKGADLSAASFPMLYVGASVVFLLAAIPLGRLSDRVGPAKVFIGGELLMLAVFAVLATGSGSLPSLLLLLVLLGGYYAATDGVLMALASSIVPPRVRASGLALLTVIIVVGHLVASVAYGAAWQLVGSETASRLFFVGLLAAVVVGARMLRPITSAAQR